MTGQLSLDLGPLPVATAYVHAARPLRGRSMWWRGRRREIVNVPVAVGAVL